jgi:hypothetical protein
MSNLETLMTTCVELGSARTMELLGVSSGEVSKRKARDIYGKWFSDAVFAGRLRPCRVEDGRAGTQWYRVVDILALKAQDCARAELKYDTKSL